MATLLHIDSSTFAGRASTSRAITETFRRTWLEENPGGEVIYRDLAAEPVPHITADAYNAGSVDPAERTEEQARAFAGRLALIEELEAADAVVIGVPMYNFAVPSTLKAWLDQVILIGRTALSPESKVKDMPVTVVATRGGSYAPGTPRAPHEHVLNYLESVLTVILAMEPTFIVADLTLAAHIPAMEHLVPLGEQSRADAFEAAEKAARAA
ncbi:FMN-dependent NADH-azoreductase [Streptomyces beijiangensis]|uniref:FMN dependent NADH:quinone oxidoreductase n=1 Tax=Streptomyces beijiangensis TaxID=163361 RepID=A0A939FDV2_9ACTN|nr:NAD(P)H-dependent oxidoreductase [Streptomyces beijiangensis]MBO0517285.1 NAD(P)H-dependent oxidoreductase [Streptomyces beijiangensis]